MCFNSQIRCKSISEIDDAAFIRRIALDEARENPHAYKKPLSPVILSNKFQLFSQKNCLKLWILNFCSTWFGW